MSDRLHLRYKCTLLLGEKRTPGSIIVDKSLKNYSFSVSKGGQHVKMKLLQDGKTIKAESVVDFFKPNILQILRTNDYDKLRDGEKTKLSNITHPIEEAVRQFAGLLKQELPGYDINDELIVRPYYEWSLGDNQWFLVPQELRGTLIADRSSGTLNAITAKSLQEVLFEDEEAVVATSYLHQARNSENRRYQWIYATMAAELAVKEILVRIEPKLQVIVETFPSPPLDGLYCDVFRKIAKTKSIEDDRNTLRDGARTRNRLVHNPRSHTPTLEEVNEYINFIEGRVRWLLKEWRRIKREKAATNKR